MLPAFPEMTDLARLHQFARAHLIDIIQARGADQALARSGDAFEAMLARAAANYGYGR